MFQPHCSSWVRRSTSWWLWCPCDRRGRFHLQLPWLPGNFISRNLTFSIDVESVVCLTVTTSCCSVIYTITTGMNDLCQKEDVCVFYFYFYFKFIYLYSYVSLFIFAVWFTVYSLHLKLNPLTFLCNMCASADKFNFPKYRLSAGGGVDSVSCGELRCLASQKRKF